MSDQCKSEKKERHFRRIDNADFFSFHKKKPCLCMLCVQTRGKNKIAKIEKIKIFLLATSWLIQMKNCRKSKVFFNNIKQK